MTPTIHEQAEELAGPHAEGCEVMLARAMHEDGDFGCDCGQSERVAGILKLMEDLEQTEDSLGSYQANAHMYVEEHVRNGELLKKAEAAEAKVRELEDYARHLQAHRNQIAELLKGEAEARKAALEEAAEVAFHEVLFSEADDLFPNLADKAANAIRALAEKEQG